MSTRANSPSDRSGGSEWSIPLPPLVARPLLLFFIGVVFSTASAINILLTLSTLVIITLYFAKAVLWVTEQIMRRVAQSSKGPLLAMSGLIGAIAALAKAFS